MGLLAELVCVEASCSGHTPQSDDLLLLCLSSSLEVFRVCHVQTLHLLSALGTSVGCECVCVCKEMEVAEHDAVNLIRVLERCAALADGIETLPPGQLARLSRLQRCD